MHFYVQNVRYLTKHRMVQDSYRVVQDVTGIERMDQRTAFNNVITQQNTSL